MSYENLAGTGSRSASRRMLRRRRYPDDTGSFTLSLTTVGMHGMDAARTVDRPLVGTALLRGHRRYGCCGRDRSGCYSYSLGLEIVYVPAVLGDLRAVPREHHSRCSGARWSSNTVTSQSR